MDNKNANTESLQATLRTTITRLAKRGSYNRQTIYDILDEALFCTVAFEHDGTPFQIPTGFVRVKDQIYLHGSVGSYLRGLAPANRPVSISATLIDGLVLARSAFHHSVNYRSVVLFSQARMVTDVNEMTRSLEAFTEKMVPGRWAEIRKPTEQELKKTLVLAFPIDEASAKIRTGPPIDDEEDYQMDVWAGVVPINTSRGTGIPDERLKPGVKLPDYLKYKA